MTPPGSTPVQFCNLVLGCDSILIFFPVRRIIANAFWLDHQVDITYVA